MSQEQLQAFISQLQGNKSMQAALDKATDYETVSLITQEAGLKATFEEPRMELTNQDLESAAGGTITLSTGSCGNTCTATCSTCARQC